MLEQNLIKLFEKPNLRPISGMKQLSVGSLIKLEYNIQEGDKERMQTYEGLVIAKQNRGLNQTITMRRKIQGVGLEQIFPVNSPKIKSVTLISPSKVRRAKLFFTRALSAKATRLKLKRPA